MATETTARLSVRLPGSVYATLKRAAELKGCSIADFVVTAAQEAARLAIEEAELIRLSAEDQRRFAAALLNAPAPNTALRKARQRHAAQVDVR
jgi:uncharacterized protein (DUF1778 family)